MNSFNISDVIKLVTEFIFSEKRTTHASIESHIKSNIDLSNEQLKTCINVLNIHLLGFQQTILVKNDISYDFDTEEFYVTGTGVPNGKILCVEERTLLAGCKKILSNPNEHDENTVNMAKSAMPNIQAVIDSAVKKAEKDTLKGCGLSNKMVVEAIEKRSYAQRANKKLIDLIINKTKTIKKELAKDAAGLITVWYISADIESRTSFSETLKEKYGIVM